MALTHSLFFALLVFISFFQLGYARPVTPGAVYISGRAATRINIQSIAAKSLGRTSDPDFNPNIFRDGGGGGKVNGYHVAVFSDTSTTEGGQDGKLTSMVHNTVAYFGHRDPSNPAALTEVGNFDKGAGQRTFVSATFEPVDEVEKAMGVDFGIWPNANLINVKGTNKMIGIYQAQRIHNMVPTLLYNTMVLLDVPTPPPTSGQVELPASRPVPQLFQANEPQYGSFAIHKAHKHLYMFATNDKKGVKVARTPLTALTDKTQYEYWNGREWSNQMPALDDTSANVYNWNNYGIGSGDVFWSRHFKTLVMTFLPVMSQDMQMIYSLSGDATGPWSEPQTIHTLEVDPSCGKSGYVYNGHAYPHWDESGKTLLLSWASCASYVRMAQVTFA